MNVLDAAITRVRNVFKNDCKIYLSFSSGKDSLCMASIVYDLIRAGEIDGTKEPLPLDMDTVTLTLWSIE